MEGNGLSLSVNKNNFTNVKASEFALQLLDMHVTKYFIVLNTNSSKYVFCSLWDIILSPLVTYCQHIHVHPTKQNLHLYTFVNVTEFFIQIETFLLYFFSSTAHIF
jgi:hypothetical protein